MKLKFNGTVLAERFYDPQRGDVEGQMLLRQPFGTKGYLQLLGELAGQKIAIPIRLAFKSRDDLTAAANAIYAAKLTHGDLELEYTAGSKKTTGGTEKIGKATLIGVNEIRPRSVMVFDSELKGSGWQVTLLLVFQTLEPPAAGKGGFGR